MLSTTPLPRILLVEDDAEAAELVCRMIGESARFTIRRDLATAREALRSAALFDGVIVDVSLPDGSGFDLVAFVRASDPHVPVLILTALDDRRVMELAAIHHACFLTKPATFEALLAFVARGREHRNAADSRLAGIVATCADRHHLSPREQEILMLAARGYARGEIETRLGIEASTAKTLVRRMLRKTRFFSLGDLVAQMHRDLFDWGVRARLSSRPPPARGSVAPQGGQTRAARAARWRT